MYRLFVLCCLLITTPVFAQDNSALPRVIGAQSSVVDDGRDLAVTLTVSDAVPHRVFTLDDPRRLVVDFEGLDWGNVAAQTLNQSETVTDLRFGPLRAGWSRLVLDLGTPMMVETAGMSVADTATLSIRLVPTNAETFAANAGAPKGGISAQIASAAAVIPAPAPDDGRITVVIDPGHGGIDPGAIQGGVQEADLMLLLAEELAAVLNATDNVRAVLTREADVFVSLEGRMSLARAVDADIFMSLHADALEADDARGASVYTLSDTGVEKSVERMAARHERGDMLAGVDLRGQGDGVAAALMDLARAQTGPQGDRFAQAVVAALRASGARLNSRPRRVGQFAVLNAPDFASVLIEAGFLSNETDRAVLVTQAGRARLVAGIAQAVQLWAQDEAARATGLLK